jgi:OmpA-OmpF porin, OOP family
MNMTLSHKHLKNWPLAAVALAIACSASAQVGTTGTSDPATSSGTVTGQTSTGTTGTTGTTQPGMGTDTGTSGAPGTTTPGMTGSTTGTTGTMGTTGSNTGTMGTTGSTTGTMGTTDTTSSGSATGSTMDTRSGMTTDGRGYGSQSGGWMGRPMYAQGEGNYSLIPYSSQGYVGINAGQPKFDTPCVTGFACNNRTTSYKLYTGGMFNEFLGGELAYVDMGRVNRAGGKTNAYGFNLSVVGRMPVGAVNLFAKAGTTYGRTRTNGTPGLITTGKDKGWGGSYGLGVGFDVTRNSSIVLEWERHDFRFSGLGRQSVDSTSLGYMHRF